MRFFFKLKNSNKTQLGKMLIYACNAPTPKAETGGRGASGLV